MTSHAQNVCIIFVLIVMLCSRVQAFYLKTINNVTKTVITKYNCVCVYLMYSRRQQGGSLVIVSSSSTG